MRRAITILILLTIVGAAAWTIYRWDRPSAAGSDPWRAVPMQSAIVLELNEPWTVWDRFTHTSQLWGAVVEQAAPAAMGRVIARAVERMENDAALRNALNGSPVLVALMRGGAEGTGCIVVGSFSGTAPVGAFSELLGIDKAGERALLGGAAVQARPDTALPALSVSVQGALWMLATSPTLMDEAMLQLQSGSSIVDDTLFARARTTLGAGVDAHLLLHTVRAQRLLLDLWDATTVDRTDLPEGWLAMDLRTRPDALLMSGLFAPAHAHAVLADLVEQGIGPWNFARLLPSSTDRCKTLRLVDPTAFRATHALTDTLSEILLAQVSGSVCLAAASGPELGAPRRWLLLETADATAAAEGCTAICPEGRCDTMHYRGQRITRLPAALAFEGLFGPDDPGFATPWWTTLGQNVVVSEAPERLRECIDAWNDGSTLAEDERASGWFQRMSANSGRTVWIDVARSKGLLREGVRPDKKQLMDAWDPVLSALGAFSVQLSAGQHGFTHVAAGLQYAPLSVSDHGLLWSVALGTRVLRSPDIVVNHTNGTREVLVQDSLDRIHLIGATGKVLWTRALDGPIMGQVTQVDRFRNGKLQLLFNTAGRIHLIDRNGKDVGGYPVELRSRATAPLAVFDYDGERDYRVLAPVEDGRLLNYGLDGLPVKGWEPVKSEARIATPVHHLRVRNKDYLLAIDADGRIRLLDRRGAERDRTSLVLDRLREVHRIVPGIDLNSARIEWSDQDLNARISTLGNEELQRTEGRSGHVRLLDMDNDNEPEAVRVVHDSVIVRNARGILFSLSLGADLAPSVQAIPMGKDRTLIGLVSPAADRVHLLDAIGRESPGFPMQGCVPFRVADLNLDGTLEVVTVTRDGRVEAHRQGAAAVRVPLKL